MARRSLSSGVMVGVIWQLAATGPTGAPGPLGGALSVGGLTALVVIGAAILTVVLVILGLRAVRRLDGRRRQRPQDDPITERARRDQRRHPENYDSRREAHPGSPRRSP